MKCKKTCIKCGDAIAECLCDKDIQGIEKGRCFPEINKAILFKRDTLLMGDGSRGNIICEKCFKSIKLKK